ncbi:MAG: cation transporter [Fimbriimonadaceae bacterium]|nr:cation transporter [Fimbriimonadaceae bacterium]
MDALARRPVVFAAAVSLLATVLVVAAKLVAGFVTGSVSVLGEALQSTVDVFVSATAVFVVRAAAMPPDADHPYGHGKVEILSSFLQMIAIIASSLYILWEAYGRLRHPIPVQVDWGIAAMGYAAVSNTLVSRYLVRVSRKFPSTALEAEALHLRADTLSSAGVLVGLVLVRVTGNPILDPVVAAVFVVVTIGAASVKLRELTHPLLDRSLPIEDVRRVEQVLRAHPETRGYHRLRSRYVGTTRFVDLHVQLDDHLTFVQAHTIAEELEDAISEALGGAGVTIHYEPSIAETAHRLTNHPTDPLAETSWSGPR